MPAFLEVGPGGPNTNNNRYIQRARRLEELADRLNPILQGLLSPTASTIPTCFNATRIPKISLPQYLQRIMHYCPTTRSAYIVSFIYLHRVAAKCGHDFIHTNSIHRLLIACVVLGSKFCDDHFKKNSFYARVGGFTVEELNEMEVELLRKLDYELFVGKSEYIAFEKFVYSTMVEDMLIKEKISSEMAAAADLEENIAPKRSASADDALLPIYSSLSILTGGRDTCVSDEEVDSPPSSPETIFSSPLRQLASLFAF